jgi:hypothetical protein
MHKLKATEKQNINNDSKYNVNNCNNLQVIIRNINDVV